MADDKQATRPSDLEVTSTEPAAGTEEKMEVDDTPSGTGSVEVATESAKHTDKSTDPMTPTASDATSGIEMALETPVETPASEDKPLLASDVAAPPPCVKKSTPPQKKSSLGGAIRKILSPHKKDKEDEDSSSPKKGKSGAKSFMGRLMSKSPTKKSSSMETTASEKQEAAVCPQDQPLVEIEPSDLETSPDPSQQKKSQKGFGSKLKKSLSSVTGFFSGNKGSVTSAVPEEVGLMADPETGATPMETEEQTTKVIITEPEREEVGDEDMEKETETTSKFQPFWEEGRMSFRSQTDPTLTQLTDIPSVSSDVFISEGEASSDKELLNPAKSGQKTGSTGSEGAGSDEMRGEDPSDPEDGEMKSTEQDSATAEEASTVKEMKNKEQGSEEAAADEEMKSEQNAANGHEMEDGSASSTVDEKDSTKRQEDTPAEVLMQEEDSATGTSSPKKSNVTTGEEMPEEGADKESEEKTG